MIADEILLAFWPFFRKTLIENCSASPELPLPQPGVVVAIRLSCLQLLVGDLPMRRPFRAA